MEIFCWIEAFPLWP